MMCPLSGLRRVLSVLLLVSGAAVVMVSLVSLFSLYSSSSSMLTASALCIFLFILINLLIYGSKGNPSL